MLLGSSNRQQFNRIGFVADPYAAGPYAEGSYEVILPVTPALIQAVDAASIEIYFETYIFSLDATGFAVRAFFFALAASRAALRSLMVGSRSSFT